MAPEDWAASSRPERGIFDHRYRGYTRDGPRTFDEAKLSVFAAHGVNRVNLGVQSFSIASCPVGRAHCAYTVRRSPHCSLSAWQTWALTISGLPPD